MKLGHWLNADQRSRIVDLYAASPEDTMVICVEDAGWT